LCNCTTQSRLLVTWLNLSYCVVIIVAWITNIMLQMFQQQKSVWSWLCLGPVLPALMGEGSETISCLALLFSSSSAVVHRHYCYTSVLVTFNHLGVIPVNMPSFSHHSWFSQMLLGRLVFAILIWKMHKYIELKDKQPITKPMSMRLKCPVCWTMLSTLRLWIAL